MTTGIFHIPGATGGGRYRQPFRWTDAADARLMEHVADGWNWSVIAQRLKVNKAECERRFEALAKRMGAQAV